MSNEAESDNIIHLNLGGAGQTQNPIVAAIEGLAGQMSEMHSFNGRLMQAYERMGGRLIESHERMSDRLESAEKAQDKMAEKFLEMLETHEKALSEQQERDLKAKESEMYQGMAQELVKDLKTLVPMVSKRLSGVALLPKEKGNGVRDFLASLDDEQLGKIAEHLTPSQQYLIMTMIEEARAADAEDETEGNENAESGSATDDG